MARILLLQPRVGDFDGIRSAPHFPLGLLHAATLLRQRHDVTLLDERIDRDFGSRLSAELAWADLVALTAMSGSQVGHACRLARSVRRAGSTPIAWGGIHPTLEPEQVLQSGLADFAIRGEGEEALAGLADAIDRGGGFEELPSLSFRSQGRQIVHNPRGRPLDLDALPEPPYDLVDPRAYMPSFAGRPTLNVETSRGCPNACSFCYNQVFNERRWRARSAARAVDGLLALAARWGITSFYLTDDNFFADVPRALDIARRIVDARRDLRYQLQGVEIRTMLDLAPADYDLLVQSGCNRFSVGADSGSPRILKDLRKRHTAGQILEANRRVRDYPIIVYYSLLSGLPGETVEDLNATLDLALRLTDENPNARCSPLYNYFPFPGTPLYRRICAETGYRPIEALEDWAHVGYGSINVNYLGADMRRVLRRAYIPSLFIDDKFSEYDTSALFRLAARAYRPLARQRLRRKFFALPVESLLYDLVLAGRGESRKGVAT